MSSSIRPFTLPAEQLDTRSLIGTPASARASAAAFIPTHLVDASACIISIWTSIAVLGNSSRKSTGLIASLVTMEISLLLLLGPGRLLSEVEKGAMLYVVLSIALSASSSCFGYTLLGPYTPAIAVVLPSLNIAEPSAFFITPTRASIFLSSSGFLPSVLVIDFIYITFL